MSTAVCYLSSLSSQPWDWVEEYSDGNNFVSKNFFVIIEQKRN